MFLIDRIKKKAFFQERVNCDGAFISRVLNSIPVTDVLIIITRTLTNLVNQLCVRSLEQKNATY